MVFQKFVLLLLAEVRHLCIIRPEMDFLSLG